MRCEKCEYPIDYLIEKGATKRIKRGDGIFHDECWRKDYIEKNSFKKNYMDKVEDQADRWGDPEA